MMQTVNISLTTPQVQAIQALIKQGRFASVSEAVREAVWNRFLKEELTENGYTPEAEASLVRALKNPKNREIVKTPPGLSVEQELEYLMQHEDLWSD